MERRLDAHPERGALNPGLMRISMLTFTPRSGVRLIAPVEFILLALITCAAVFAFVLPSHAANSVPTVEVTDLAGRTVRVKKGVARMILGEGRQLYGLSV